LPTIIVSHDFGDIAGLAQRVAVMDGGRLAQTGSPDELMRAPRSAFVAASVGTNYLTGKARRVGDVTVVDLDDGGHLVSSDIASGVVAAVIQPWDVTVSEAGADEPDSNVIVGPVSNVVARGGALRVTVSGRPQMVADVHPASPVARTLHPGVVVAVVWSRRLTRLVAAEAAPQADGDAYDA
jgi:tungstate transport system ATP-binding protein